MNPLSEKSLKDKTRNLLSNARWVLKFTWDTSPGLLLGIMIFRLIQSAMPAALAWIMRCLINAVVDASKQGIHELGTVLPWIILSLILVLLDESVGVCSQFLNRDLNEKLRLKIEMDKLHHAARLDISWFEDPTFQDISARAQQNTSAHFTGMLRKILGLGTTTLQITGLIIILFAIDPIVVLFTIPIFFPFVLFRWSQSRMRYNKEYSRATKRRWSSYFSSMLTSKNAISENKLLNLAPLLLHRYYTLAKDFLKEDRQIYTRGFIGNFIFSVIFAVVFYALFGRITWLVLGDQLTIGDIAMFAGATRQLQGFLGSLAGQASGVVEDTLYINDLSEFMKTEPRIKSTSEKKMPSHRGEIELRNVSFAYPGSNRTILSKISLHIKPGETIALVGKNGAGKTTLVKLIARLYDPDEGCILFDHTDLRELSLDDLYGQISFVFQNANRYEATAAENIAYGHWQQIQNKEQIEKIARLANVDDMIRAMPDGYDTMLGRKFGQYDLSGGQWKKMAIARAMARDNSSLIILDEPTAGLDAKAEHELFLHFRELSAGRTTILISHQFSTVNIADRIIVMDKGEIVESGTHEALLDKNDLYASLYDLQKNRLIKR